MIKLCLYVGALYGSNENVQWFTMIYVKSISHTHMIKYGLWIGLSIVKLLERQYVSRDRRQGTRYVSRDNPIYYWRWFFVQCGKHYVKQNKSFPPNYVSFENPCNSETLAKWWQFNVLKAICYLCIILMWHYIRNIGNIWLFLILFLS